MCFGDLRISKDAKSRDALMKSEHLGSALSSTKIAMDNPGLISVNSGKDKNEDCVSRDVVEPACVDLTKVPHY